MVLEVIKITGHQLSYALLFLWISILDFVLHFD